VDVEKIRSDFDHIARLADGRETRIDRYDAFLLAQVPAGAVDVLEVGCGLGHLTAALAAGPRDVTSIDLSPEMIARARRRTPATSRVSFLCADFLAHDFESSTFDCIVSAATLHHLPVEIAVSRMVALLRPGGRLVIHDLRSNTGLLDHVRSAAALAPVPMLRLGRTGRLRSPREVRDAWSRHGAGETYFTLAEAQALANRLLPGSRVYSHWLWRYTTVWDKPSTPLEAVMSPPGPLVEVVELLSRKLICLNHVPASAIAHHCLTGAKRIGDTHERDGRGALEDSEPARALACGARSLHVETVHPAVREPDVVFAIDQRHAGLRRDNRRTRDQFDAIEVVHAVAEYTHRCAGVQEEPAPRLSAIAARPWFVRNTALSGRTEGAAFDSTARSSR